MPPELFKKGVLIIESSNARELMHGAAEGPAVRSILKIMDVPCLYREVFCIKDLESVAKLFEGHVFSAVYISAHGSSSGIELTSQEFVSWDLFFKMFPMTDEQQLFLSSCSTLKDRVLLDHLENMGIGPGIIIGYDVDMKWDEVLLATMFMINAVGSEGIDMFASLGALFMGIGVCVRCALRSEDGSGKMEYVDIRGDRVFSRLIDDIRTGRTNKMADGLVELGRITSK